MLRISTIDTATERRLVLEGKLVDPWVAELTRSCSNAAEGLAERKLVIDIKNVTVISCEGENALLTLMREGAKFSCHGVLTRYVLKRLERQCRYRLQATLKPAKSSPRRAKRNRGEHASDQSYSGQESHGLCDRWGLLPSLPKRDE